MPAATDTQDSGLRTQHSDKLADWIKRQTEQGAVISSNFIESADGWDCSLKEWWVKCGNGEDLMWFAAHVGVAPRLIDRALARILRDASTHARYESPVLPMIKQMIDVVAARGRGASPLIEVESTQALRDFCEQLLSAVVWAQNIACTLDLLMATLSAVSAHWCSPDHRAMRAEASVDHAARQSALETAAVLGDEVDHVYRYGDIIREEIPWAVVAAALE